MTVMTQQRKKWTTKTGMRANGRRRIVQSFAPGLRNNKFAIAIRMVAKVSFCDKILPGKETNVLSLDLSSNLISDIQPGTFNQFTKLQVLMLTHNKLDSQQISVDVFTPGLGKSLHHLYLDYNFITTLDEGVFGNLSKLKKLVLDGNREIQLLRGVFTNAFDVLEVLSLDKCGIKELDEDIFANLTSLRALSLSGNPLDRIPLALSPLHSLTHFAMSSTNLKELKEGAFQTTVPGLEKLYMRKMKYLWKIGTNAFTGLKKLKFLDFGYSTKLQLLEANVFGLDPPRNFSELNLQQCNLSTLSAEIMSPIYWKSMDVIKLEGNPFWLLDMKNVMRIIYRTDEPTCKYPSDLEGLSLYDANKLNDLCEPTPSSTGKFSVFLICMIISASLVAVGFVYARRRYKAKYGWDVHFSRFVGGSSAFPRANQMGIFDDGVEENEAEETAAASGGR
uniref:LRRCT domain-containing protein n=1 Tax=Globodera pallida TaxID=36090 RepID=A0A183CPP9_GLOPA